MKVFDGRANNNIYRINLIHEHITPGTAPEESETIPARVEQSSDTNAERTACDHRREEQSHAR